MTRVAKKAPRRLKASVEVIDLLSLWPWDEDTVKKSVAKTGRLVTVEEAPAGTGWGGHHGRHDHGQPVRHAEGAAAPHHAPRCADPLQRHAGSALSPDPDYVAAQIDALVTTGRSPQAWWKEAS